MINHLFRIPHPHRNPNRYVCLCLADDKRRIYSHVVTSFIALLCLRNDWNWTLVPGLPLHPSLSLSSRSFPRLSLCIPPPSWSAASLTWRWTSSSRNPRASCAWWSCWTSASPRVRRKFGASSQPSLRRASATCRRALMWGWSSWCSSVYPPLTAWLQVMGGKKRHRTHF